MIAFPLLKLPSIPLEFIIRQFDPPDVIELAMMSGKFQQRMTNIKLKIAKVELYESHESYIYFKLESKESGMYSKMMKTKIDGCPVEIRKILLPSTVMFSIAKGISNKQSAEKISKYFLSFLQIEHFEIRFRKFVKTPRANFKDLFIWNITKLFHRVSIAEYSPPAEVTVEELKFLLEDITTNFFYLNIALKEDVTYTYQKPLSVATVIFHESNWLDMSSLSNWKCENIKIELAKDSKLNLNDFLKKWIEGKNEELDYFMAVGNYYKTYEFENVFEGIETTPTVFSDQKLIYRGSRPKGRKLDIRRRNDNRVATLILRKAHFDMIVWKEKHLNNLNVQLNPFG